jgi:hypothetical protein
VWSFLRRVQRYVAVRLIRVARRLVPSSRRADYLLIEPASLSQPAWADVAARINWYLPNLRVPIAAPGVSGPDPADAPHMAPGFVREPRGRTPAADGREHVVLTRLEVRGLIKRGRRLGATTLVDPHLWSGEDTRGYPELMHLFGGTGHSTTTIDQLLAQRVDGGTAVIVGTGPSADMLDEAAYDADIRITCNSAVRNLDFIDAFRPTIIAFADPIHHLGPSRYAAAFRLDLLKALHRSEALAVVPPLGAELLTQHYPEIADRVLSLPMYHGHWRWPTEHDPHVRHTGNILTLYMLPLAFALADQVSIAGCDGRKPTEPLFWRHSRTIQYDDELMETLFMAHPGWYRDYDYASYYAQHCGELEELVSTGEAAGKFVRSLTDSFIPALSRRHASRGR